MISIIPLTETYYQQALLLANKVHGDNYLDLSSLVDMQKKASKNAINANFIALEGDTVMGLRLSYAANQWPLDEWCTPSLWPCAQTDMAYFKCIAIAPNQQGKGIGPKLEQLCHSLGFFHFDQVANWTDEEVAWVDANLEGFKDRVTRDQWVAQAKELAKR